MANIRLIIAGSRSIEGVDTVRIAMEQFMKAHPDYNIIQVVSGGALGVDIAGEQWAHMHDIPVAVYKPDYAVFGRKMAPLIRNERMAQVADALVAVWDRRSRGTKHMINAAQLRGLKVFIYCPPTI